MPQCSLPLKSMVSVERRCRCWGLLGIFLGGSPVHFTAQAQSSLPLSWTCSWIYRWAWIWPVHCLDCLQAFHPHAPSAISHSFKGESSKPAAVPHLTIATQSLAAALDPPFQPGSCTSNFVISIIKDSYVIPSWRKLLIFWRRKALLNYLIASKLSRRTSSFTSLVILQLELGLHFAWVFRSIDTNTPFECETPNSDFCVSHGVVLRSPYKVLRQALHGKGIFRTFWTG